MSKDAYVYFMTNGNSNVNPDSFTEKYKCHKLVYFEHTNDIRTAIEREKQLKNWKREWENEVIEKQNPVCTGFEH